MNIQGFVSSFQEMARNNRFRVTGLGGPSELCFNVDLGTRSVMTTEQRGADQGRGGLSYVSVPYEEEYAPITLSYYQDDAGTNWKYFNDWFIKEVSSNGVGYGHYRDIIRDFKVEQLDRQGNPLQTWSIKEAYPISITGPTFDATTQNGVTTFSVQLKYHKIDVK